MNRTTSKITLPSGAVVEHYAYLTGKEARQIQTRFLEAAEIHAKDVQDAQSTFRASVIPEIQALSLKMLIISFEAAGERQEGEAAFEAVENLPVIEYNSVVKALEPIVNPVFIERTDFLAQPSTPSSA
jgi:hypothetical protein